MRFREWVHNGAKFVAVGSCLFLLIYSSLAILWDTRLIKDYWQPYGDWYQKETGFVISAQSKKGDSISRLRDLLVTAKNTVSNLETAIAVEEEEEEETGEASEKSKKALQSTEERLLEETVPLYIVTPTYPRLEQIPDMTRLGQTLKNVRNMVWLVCDDTRAINVPLLQLLDRTKVEYIYFKTPRPEHYINSLPDNVKRPRGVSNRNAAIRWIHEKADESGIIYFADDDNTYDLRLFEEIRHTKTVSVFPVGLIGSYALSSPIVENGRVTGFYDSYKEKRKFLVDMAGFAVKVKHLRKMSVAGPVQMIQKGGYIEDDFLRQIVNSMAELQPLADNCTKVMAWHTRTHSNKIPETDVPYKYTNSNLVILLRDLKRIINMI